MWIGFSEWRGLDGRTTRRQYQLQVPGSDGAAFVAALDANNVIVTALDFITEATLNDSGVTYVTELYTIGLGSLTQHALVNVWAVGSDPLDVLSIAQLDIPAPVVGIFQSTSGSGYNVVDATDAALQAFVDAISQNAYISDLEIIDTGTAINGIENGRRVSRPLPKRR